MDRIIKRFVFLYEINVPLRIRIRQIDDVIDIDGSIKVTSHNQAWLVYFMSTDSKFRELVRRFEKTVVKGKGKGKAYNGGFFSMI